MKLKKKTSMLMIASATAAVVGIAAVSFAAWTGSDHTLNASATTGTVSLVGFNENKLDFGNLVPVDQVESTIIDGERFVSKALDYTVTNNFTFTVKLESTAINNVAVYVYFGNEVTETPSKDYVEANYTQVTATATAEGLSYSLDTKPAYMTMVIVSEVKNLNNDTLAELQNKPIKVSVELNQADLNN